MRAQSEVWLATRCVAIILVSMPAIRAQTQEDCTLGRMWTFENPPRAYLEREYGLVPDQKWLDTLRLSSLRLAGEDVEHSLGSASFVSPRGLTLTSAQSVRRAIAITLDEAGPRRNNPLGIIKTGFVAHSRDKELRLRAEDDQWLSALQLVAMTDVTDQVNRDVVSADLPTRRQQKRDANKQAVLESALETNPDLVPQIVSLYRGAQVQLYQYKRFDDVRLVMIPHVPVTIFGDGQGAFQYPRHALDIAFLRVYDNGQPADSSKNYFKWSERGPERDQLVFVSGNLGQTSRLLTETQAALEREIRVPMAVDMLSNRWRSKTGRVGFDPEVPSQPWASGWVGILQLERDLIATQGAMAGLQDPKRMTRKAALERKFKERIATDKVLATRYGDLWRQIDGLVTEQHRHDVRARFHTTEAAPLLDLAVTIVRAFDPAESAERRRSARRTIDNWTDRPHSPNGAWVGSCVDHVIRARRWLHEDAPYLMRVLGGKATEGWPSRMPDYLEWIEGDEAQRSPNWVGHPKARRALVESGWSAIEHSTEPAIVSARELVRLMRAHEALSSELEAREEMLGVEMGRAFVECFGTNVSCDATDTLRFADGVVAGPVLTGSESAHQTSILEMFQRSANSGNRHPLTIPQIWIDRKQSLDLAVGINFASTNDLSPGSSGSAVVNQELELVGVVIDGDMESLKNRFTYLGRDAHTISVHVDGIKESLAKIYDAHHIATELGIR